MKAKYWLVLGAVTAGTALTPACSSQFSSCTASRSCPAGGSSGIDASGAGEAGESNRGSDSAGAAGLSGQATAGADTAGSPTAGAAGESDQGPSGDLAGSAGEGGAVQTLVCDEPLSACGSSCVDLTTDTKNCGRCGHDCLGGDCAQGSCRPVIIAPDQEGPISIVVGGAYVYWMGAHDSSHQYIARRRIDTSDSVKVIASAETYASGLALSGTKLYWLSADHVRSCNLPDCSDSPQDVVPSESTRCLDLAFDASHSKLYWSCSSTYGQNDGAVWSTAAGSTPVNVEPTSRNPEYMTTDPEHLYWTNSSGFNSQDTLGPDASIWRLNFNDGSKTPLISGLTAQFGVIAVGGASLYALENTYTSGAPAGGEIVSLPLPYGAATPTKVAEGPACGMVADDHSVYWTDCFNGVVKRCPHNHCTNPDVMAPGQNSPGAMTQDSISVYWLTGRLSSTPGQTFPVQRLAK